MQQASPLVRAIFSRRIAIVFTVFFVTLFLGRLAMRGRDGMVQDVYYSSGLFIKHHLSSVSHFELQSMFPVHSEPLRRAECAKLRP